MTTRNHSNTPHYLVFHKNGTSTIPRIYGLQLEMMQRSLILPNHPNFHYKIPNPSKSQWTRRLTDLHLVQGFFGQVTDGLSKVIHSRAGEAVDSLNESCLGSRVKLVALVAVSPNWPHECYSSYSNVPSSHSMIRIRFTDSPIPILDVANFTTLQTWWQGFMEPPRNQESNGEKVQEAKRSGQCCQALK